MFLLLKESILDYMLFIVSNSYKFMLSHFGLNSSSCCHFCWWTGRSDPYLRESQGAEAEGVWAWKASRDHKRISIAACPIKQLCETGPHSPFALWHCEVTPPATELPNIVHLPRGKGEWDRQTKPKVCKCLGFCVCFAFRCVLTMISRLDKSFSCLRLPRSTACAAFYLIFLVPQTYLALQ